MAGTCPAIIVQRAANEASLIVTSKARYTAGSQASYTLNHYMRKYLQVKQLYSEHPALRNWRLESHLAQYDGCVAQNDQVDEQVEPHVADHAVAVLPARAPGNLRICCFWRHHVYQFPS